MLIEYLDSLTKRLADNVKSGGFKKSLTSELPDLIEKYQGTESVPLELWNTQSKYLTLLNMYGVLHSTEKVIINDPALASDLSIALAEEKKIYPHLHTSPQSSVKIIVSAEQEFIRQQSESEIYKHSDLATEAHQKRAASTSKPHIETQYINNRSFRVNSLTPPSTPRSKSPAPTRGGHSL